MDNYQGDLADMIRATVDGATAPTNWQFPTNTIQYSSDPVDDFGDPFSCIMGDPLMQINNIDSSQSGFLYNSTAVRTAGELAGVNSASHKVVNVDDDHMIRRPPNIFSRMLQISPNEKFGVAPPCDSTAAPLGLKCNRPPAESRGIQISSPRNTGIKRRWGI